MSCMALEESGRRLFTGSRNGMVYVRTFVFECSTNIIATITSSLKKIQPLLPSSLVSTSSGTTGVGTRLPQFSPSLIFH